MLETMVLAVMLAAAPAAGISEERTLRISAVDAKGEPLRDLAAHEVVVLENGVARRVLQVTQDERPVSLALVVDSSEALADRLRPDVVPALRAFLRRFPDGTRFALWSSGARPTQRVELTRDVTATERALQYVVPDGGNTLMDTIDQALDALTTAEGQRLVLVIVTGSGVEFSSRDRPRAVESPERRGNVEIYALQIDAPGSLGEEAHPQEDASPRERQANYEATLSTLAAATGGRHDHLLSASAAPEALSRIAAELLHGYVVRFVSPPGLKKRQLKIEIARPKTRVRQLSAPRGN